MLQKATDDEIRSSFLELRSAQAVANRFGMSARVVQNRLRNLGIPGTQPNGRKPAIASQAYYAQGRTTIKVKSGKVVVFSDAHYWPGFVSTAHRALIKIIKQEKPAVVVANGDMFDGGSISRFPRIGWDKAPTVRDELEAVKERLGEVEKAAKGAHLCWALGNHDARFETLLAAQVPQYEGVSGFHLKDHFPLWKPCWSVWINDNTAIKHRWKGGIHAPHNNTIQSGMNMVTGHLHSQKVSPWSDYRGTRYGVDCGTLSDPYGPQYEYTEDNPVNWRSGFVVLNYHEGELLHPQLVSFREEGVVEYRGELLTV